MAAVEPPDEEEMALSLHQALVKKLCDEGHIRSPQIEAAFRALPRHLFLPGLDLETVYRDEAIPTKIEAGRAISSSSQPAMMAIMLEQLDLQPGQRVLEIGAGVGYNAALMGHLVGREGRVVSVEIDEEMAAWAKESIAGVGLEQVTVVHADGSLGYPQEAPYDRIVLTAAADDIAPPWWEQLTPHGRLLLPLSLNGPQKSVAFDHAGDHLASVSVRDCGFMALRGAFAGSEQIIELGEEPGLHLALTGDQLVDRAAVYQWLTRPDSVQPTGVELTLREIWSSLNLWLAVRDPRFCTLRAAGSWLERELIPFLFRFSGNGSISFSSGLLSANDLALLARPPESLLNRENSQAERPFELFARSYGPGFAALQALLDQISLWEASGRPAAEKLHIRAFPTGVSPRPALDEFLIPRQTFTLLFSYSPE